MTRVEFNEVKILTAETEMPKVGAFSLEDPFSWFGCREQFASRFTEKLEAFYFSHAPNNGAKVANFIRKTEEILSVAEKIDFSQFSLTNRPYVLWVKPSGFWSSCAVRRSLFTILLRCGMFYDVDANNYENALQTDEYARQTHQSIRRFLFGYTLFKSGAVCRGWRDTFKEKTLNEVRDLLILPKNTLLEKTMIGHGSIWN